MRGRWLLSVLLVLVGLVWIGQGSGLLAGSSFMVGDPLWAVIGLVLVVAGIVVGVSAHRSRPHGP